VWHGQVKGLQAGTVRLGDGEWRLQPLRLFIGQAAAEVKFTLPQGFAQGHVKAGFSSATLSDVTASLPLGALTGGALPSGWTGSAQAKFSSITLDHGWPVSANGTLDIVDITGPASQPENIGSYRFSFDGQGAAGSAGDALLAKVQDQQAAIAVTGTLKLMRNRSYELNTMIAARANTPAFIRDSIQYLGEADAEGRRNFTASGTL